jgi:hypothetical protein
MKIFKFLPLLILSVIVLSACSNNEHLLTEIEQKNSLKSYVVKRDASGAYSLDYELERDVKSQKVKNIDTNVNEFHLYQSDFENSQRQSEEIFIDGNRLSIGFIDTRTNKKSNITIEDGVASSTKTLAKGEKMLSEYSITGNEDGTFNLDFKVNNQVAVDFVLVEETGVYEIHLQEGKSEESVFSRNFEKGVAETLKIDFVNHIDNNSSSKNTESKSLVKRKPRIVVSNGSEY